MKKFDEVTQESNFMGVEGAPPVASRHLCHISSQGADMSKYIDFMTKNANTGLGRSDETYQWWKDISGGLGELASGVSNRASEWANEAGNLGIRTSRAWEDTYGDVYGAQAKDTMGMMRDLPAAQEQAAGEAGADISRGFDQAKAAEDRKMRGYGMKPGVGQAALDQQASAQRVLGITAAANNARKLKADEARAATASTLQSGERRAGVGGQQYNAALAAGQQQGTMPMQAINTGVNASAVPLNWYNAARPYAGAWETATLGSERNQLERAKAAEAASGGSPIIGMLGGLAGTAVGSMAGGVGGGAGAALSKSLFGAKGGMISDVEDTSGQEGGDNFVDPSMSPSDGAITDDVPARLNAGEFVIPKDVVAWRGEAWFQKEIMKARKEREEQTVAEPEMGQASAIDMQAPTFQSEGAAA